jgi:hypothetical protein
MIMASHNLTTPLRTSWQDQVEISLEVGEAPLLDLGVSNGVLDSIPALATLHAFAEQRMDMTAPTIVSGGNSLLWLAALMHLRNPAPRSPNLTVVYGGADLATHIASLMTQRSNPPSRLVQPDALPASLAPLLAPGAQSGPLLWETLPLAAAEEHSAAVGRPDEANLPAGDPWLTWTAMILAVALVVIALMA